MEISVGGEIMLRRGRSDDTAGGGATTQGTGCRAELAPGSKRDVASALSESHTYISDSYSPPEEWTLDSSSPTHHHETLGVGGLRALQ